MRPDQIQKSREIASAFVESAKESMAMLRDGIKRETDRQALVSAVKEDLAALKEIIDILREAGVELPDLQAAHEGAINEARALGINLGNDHALSAQEIQAAKQALKSIEATVDLIAALKEDLGDPDMAEEIKEEVVMVKGGYDEVAGLVRRLAGAVPPDLREAFDAVHREIMELNAEHAFWPQLGNIEAAAPMQLEEPAHALAVPERNQADCWLEDNHTHYCNIPAGALANHSGVDSE